MTEKWNFKRPNKGSVEVGDLCMLSGSITQRPHPSRVEAVEDDYLVVNKNPPLQVVYMDAVILKRDGSYLIGERVAWYIDHPSGEE